MESFKAIKEIIEDMEKVAMVLDVKPFPIYFLGGSACILGGYAKRATRDFDFVDLMYPAEYGKVLRYLNDFDMLEYESTILAPSYKKRAKKLEEFTYLKIFVLSREDIVVSKIVRMGKKDIADMDILMKECDRDLIDKIINEVLNREDLYDSKKKAFKKYLSIFRERYNV
jgi:hypothetical protein